ncbi:SAM-dependent methyltransferase [Actinoallomurus oryzae]|uniref:SAM-dependent methyltransferase n=1 Tax=Actinoallomurus oryzae TaxID=502180 RepID=A0ABP8QUL5_9ACTN
MNDDVPSQPPFNVTTPTPARIYDYYLGGKDNFPADREAGEKVMRVFPQAPELALANRGFLLRAVRYCADAGIDQFIDLGTGIPTSPNVAEIACAFNPRARVIGVDNDPVVLSHQRAHASSVSGGYTIVEGDVRRPWAILADSRLNEVIDLSRPVAVLCVAVLHFVPDAEDPAGILGAFTDTITAGSYLAVSAVTSTDTDPAVVTQIEDAYKNASAPLIFRTADQILSWFGPSLDLVHPGLLDVSQWPTGIGIPTDVRILGGVARKRRRVHPPGA